MKVVQVLGSASDPAAGPSYSVPGLSSGLAALGVDVELYSLGEPMKRRRSGVTERTFRNTLEFAPALRRLGFSSGMSKALNRVNSNIFHSHGLWMMPNVYPANVSRKRNKKFVLSPRGMLGDGALQFSRLKKQVFWSCFQKNALRQADCLHATAFSELEDIRKQGLTNPVTIIPNGIELPVMPQRTNEYVTSPYVLSLGRIHPKKGLDRLVSAWADIVGAFPEWSLRIIGPDEGGHAAELHRLANSLGVEETVSIEEPVFGEKKIEAMRNARVFALPTLHENFAMTVAESLSVETPVISTKGAPWSGLLDEGCGWWIEHGQRPLAHALCEAMSLPIPTLNEMGIRGRHWMKRDFSWETIACKMLETYEWLEGRVDKPEFVEL